MNGFEGGQVLVANRVIDQMIALAAADVEGVLAVRGFDSESGQLRHGHEKVILTETTDGVLSTRISIQVDPDASIMEVVSAVQKEVKNQVEALLGLVCGRVDVDVV